MTDNKPRNNPTSTTTPAGVAAPVGILPPVYLSTVRRGGVKYWRMWYCGKVEEVPAFCNFNDLMEVTV